jgi:Kef-type K+ transport system membrane component KefB
VLADRGQLATKEARIIMAAAVIDDVLALMMLAIVSGVAQGELSLVHTALVIGLASAFLVTVLTVGRATLRRTFPFLTRLRATDPVLGAAIAIALLLAVWADFVGLAPIVGAYIAGVLIAEVGGEEQLESKMHPLVVFLTPIFFVYVGTLMEPDQLANVEGLALVVGVTLLALAGKFLGSGGAALGLGYRSAAIIGVGMAPRGEVGIIVAALGLSLGVVGEDHYGVVVVMCLLTTLVGPPLLVGLFPKEKLAGAVDH